MAEGRELLTLRLSQLVGSTVLESEKESLSEEEKAYNALAT